MIAASGLEIKKFFNVSGMKYRELKLKDKLPTMTDEEKISLLASDGMLIKRPIVFGDGKVRSDLKKKNSKTLEKVIPFLSLCYEIWQN